MIFDLLFRNFAVWACAPNGVVNLRKLILQLALSGKLALQNLNDEPANKLLKRIQEELKNQDQQKKKQNELPPIDLTALPELPESWRWTQLSDICLIKSGNTPKNFDYSVNIDEIPFFKVSDMNNPGNEKFLINPTITINREEALAFGIQIQEPGTVVFPKRGGAIATNKKRILGKPSAYDANIMGIRIPIIPPKFLFYWLSSFDLSSLSTGSAVPQINHQDLLPLPFPLPPLAEQKRIISKIDLLMALCNDLEAKQQKEKLGCVRLGTAALTALQNATNAPDLTRFCSLVYQHFDPLFACQENVNRLRNTILHLAIKGMLVPQNPSDEPADKLLEQLSRKHDKSTGLAAASELQSNGGKTLWPLPLSWIWTDFSSISDVISGFAFASPDFASDGVPVVKISNIGYGEFLWIQQQYLPQAYAKTYSRFLVRPGNILIALTRPITRNKLKVCIYPDGAPIGLLNQRVAVIKPYDNVHVRFILHYMRSESFGDLIQESLSETCQPNLSPIALSQIKIPEPPLAEQYRIVNKIEQLMALCDQLETKIEEGQKISELFSDSVVETLLAEQ